MVGDSSSQQKYVPREDTTSPTLSLEALMTTLLIEAYENRKCIVFDVPGSYLHADILDNKFVLLKIEGEFVDIMTEVNPENSDNVRYKNGKNVLYIQILKNSMA